MVVSIPDTFKNLNIRFVRVAAKSKGVYDHNWQKRGGSNFSVDDPDLLSHLKNGGNYGVMSGFDSDIIVIDLDDSDRVQQLGATDGFPDTLTVRSGNDKKNAYHLYYHTDASEYFGKKHQFYDPALYFSDKNEDKKQAHLGEVYTPGCGAQTVGPGSIHPDSGKEYKIMRDMEPAFLPVDILKRFFGTLVTPSLFKTSIPDVDKIIRGRSSLTDELGLHITDFVVPDDIKFRKASGELQGSHPIHGSTTGTNFAVNPVKNVWFCHRDGVGGDPVSWIAYSNGWTDEGEKVEGDAFKKVVNYLKEHGYRKEIEEKERKFREENQGERLKKIRRKRSPDEETESFDFGKKDNHDLSEAAIKRGALIALNRKKALQTEIPDLISDITDYAHYLLSAKKVIKSELDLYLKLQEINVRRADSKLSEDEIDKIASRVYAAWSGNDYTTDIPEEYQKFVNISERGVVSLNYQVVADHLLDTFNVISYTGDEESDGYGLSSDLYVYNPDTGVYSKDATCLKNEIEKIARAVSLEGNIIQPTREILHYVAYHNPEREYPFNAGENFLPVLNGVIEIDFDKGEHKLHPHTPDRPFTYYLPVEYDADANPEPIDKILRQYVSENDLCYLYQIPAQAILQGFCKIKSPYKIAYLIQGLPDAGKSTYHDLMVEWFFSPQYVAKVTLQDLCGGNRFATATLPDTFLNTYDDLDDIGCLASTSDFKNLTGSFHHAVEKKHGDRKQAKISCVHMFTCNRAPLLNNKRMETDRAFWERWVYLTFKSNDFKRDPDFQSKYFTCTNMSGFLNRVLKYVVSIRKDGISRMNADDVLGNWSIHSDPLKSFIADCFYEIQNTKPVKYEKEKLLAAYRKYIEIMSLEDIHGIQTVEKFSRRIFEEGFQVARGKDNETLYQAMLKWNSPTLGGEAGGIPDPTYNGGKNPNGAISK